jgi:hypothetical protein
MRASAALSLLFVVACGGGGTGTSHVEISDKSPQEGSTIAADAFCMRQAMCGKPRVTCSADPNGTICTGTIATVVYADCVAAAQPDIEKLLSCTTATVDVKNMIETCLDAYRVFPCATQAQVDEWARMDQMSGASPPNPQPPECAFLSGGIPGCS